MADDEDEEEQNPISYSQQAIKDWEQIYAPLSFNSSSSSSSIQSLAHTQEQTQTHQRGWEMVVTENGVISSNNNNNLYGEDEYYIFPPSNHENLHIPFEQQQQQHVQSDSEIHDDQQQESSSLLPSDPPSPPQPLDSRVRVAGVVLMKRLDLVFAVLWSKFIRIGSWVRSHSSGRRTNWSFSYSATGVAAGFLISLLYMRWRRRRHQRAQQEKKDRLIVLVEQTDKKLSQLLDQIAKMNEFLSSRRGVPVMRIG